MPARTDAPKSIKLSDEERETGLLSDIHLFDAIDAFFTDGVVVLDNAIPVEVIDKMNERMAQDTDRIRRGGVKNIHWK